MREIWGRFVAYTKIAAPVYALFLLIERGYSYYRFGSFTSTYIPIFAREARQQDPTLPLNFPWSTPFHEGVVGALFKPEKSIFLFDPLLVLAILLLAILWKRLPGEVCAYAVASLGDAGRVHLFLCAIHVLGGGLCVGRPVCIDGGGVCGVDSGAAAAKVSRESRGMDVAGGDCLRRYELRHPGRVAYVLASTGNLSDGNDGASDICDRAAV